MSFDTTNNGMRCLIMVCALAVVVVTGCGGVPDTPAEYTAGVGGSLDGATIDNDGQTFEIDLAGDNSIASIQNARSGEGVMFDGIEDGVAVPREVTFGVNGESSASYDRNTGVFTGNFNVLGQNFMVSDVVDGDIPIFGIGRSGAQAGDILDMIDCAPAVSAVDTFCDTFMGDMMALEQGIIDLALDIAERNNVDPAFNGIIENEVRSLVNSVENTCAAWSEMRDSTNPCDAI
jgi:hypothetical protein